MAANRSASNLERRLVLLKVNGFYYYTHVLYDKNTDEPAAQILTILDEEEDDIQQKKAQIFTSLEEEEDHIEQKKAAEETCTNSDDEDIQLQLALFNSTITTTSRSRTTSISHHEQEGNFMKTLAMDGDDEKKKGKSSSSSSLSYGYYFETWPWKKKEKGESSHTLCDICMDMKPTGGMLISTRCTHSYCRDCMCIYIGEKIQENIASVKCPEPKCEAVFEPEHCRGAVPEEVFHRWKSAAVEASVLGSPEYIWCPFQDCSAFFVDDGKGFLIRACPKCWRLFCARCNVQWHAYMPCSFFQNSRATGRINYIERSA